MTLATATVRSGRGAPRGGRGDGRRRDGRRRDGRRRDGATWFLVLPALIPILILSVGPLLFGIALAFTDAQSGRTRSTQWVGVLNFQDLLHDTLFWDSFRIGLLWAVGVTVPQFVLALGLALLLNAN
ncbi:sugar ABC transporter permease, partial [[Kitasatospora] papulosa]